MGRPRVSSRRRLARSCGRVDGPEVLEVILVLPPVDIESKGIHCPDQARHGPPPDTGAQQIPPVPGPPEGVGSRDKSVCHLLGKGRRRCCHPRRIHHLQIICFRPSTSSLIQQLSPRHTLFLSTTLLLLIIVIVLWGIPVLGNNVTTQRSEIGKCPFQIGLLAGKDVCNMRAERKNRKTKGVDESVEKGDVGPAGDVGQEGEVVPVEFGR